MEIVRLLLCVGKTKDARQKCNNNHFKGRSSLKNVKTKLTFLITWDRAGFIFIIFIHSIHTIPAMTTMFTSKSLHSLAVATILKIKKMTDLTENSKVNDKKYKTQNNINFVLQCRPFANICTKSSLKYGCLSFFIKSLPTVFQDTLLINFAAIIGENLLLMHDDSLDDLIDRSLVGYLVTIRRYRQKGRTKADGQVVWIHHVFITVL